MLDFFVFIRLSVMIKIMYRNKSDREYYKRGNFYGRTLLLGPTLYWAADRQTHTHTDRQSDRVLSVEF